jgi:hypothetical protein
VKLWPSPPVKFRALLVTKDGFNCLEVQQHAAAVYQGLKNLIHLQAGGENKVAAVFDLIVGILVMKPAASALPNQGRNTSNC